MITLNSIKKPAKVIISLGLLARVLGFLKGILIAYFIGVNYKTDTYIVAFSATMLLTKIIADGLIVSLIPIYQQIDQRDGLKGRNEFTNNVINSYIVFSVILVAIGYIIAPLIIKAFGPGFDGLESIKAVRLFRLGLPIMTAHFIRGICGGHLQSIHAFRAGARSGVVNNLIYIVYLVTLSRWFGLEGLMITGVIAVIGQVYIMMKAMIKVGFKYKFYILLKDKLLIRLNSFMLPILIGIGINEVNFAIDNALGSSLQQGTVAELNYAYEIILFFISAFIVAIVTAMFPLLSEMFSKDKHNELNKSINFSFRLLILILVPLTVILITMSEPMVKVFYERGAFGNDSTIKTAQILVYYSIGLVGMALVLLINRIYYAINHLNTSMIIGAIALGYNLILSLILVKFMGANGIALGTSISVILTSVYGILDLNRRLGFLSWKNVLKDSLRIIFAAGFMVTVINVINSNLRALLGENLFGNLLLIISTAIIGLLAFVFIIFITKGNFSNNKSK